MIKDVFINVRQFLHDDVEIVDRLCDAGKEGRHALKGFDHYLNRVSSTTQFVWGNCFYDNNNKEFVYFIGSHTPYDKKGSKMTIYTAPGIVDLYGMFSSFAMEAPTKEYRALMLECKTHIKRSVTEWHKEERPFIEKIHLA
jgi:hypothetical protein